MILTCASCATRYYADEASIPPQGRQVRCAACGNTWRVERELVLDNGGGPAPATFIDEPQLSREQIERARKAAGLTASPTQQARARQIQRQRLENYKAAAIAWGGAGAALAAVLAVAVIFRGGVSQVWPQAASAYAAMGLDVNITSLEFSDLAITRNVDAASPTLTVSGAIRNIGAKAKAPPVLRFGLRDQNADEVRSWLVSLPGGPIEPGGARQFQSVLTAPPLSAVDLEASFATAKEAKKAPPPVATAAVEAHPAPAVAAKPVPATGARRATAAPPSSPGLTIIVPEGEDPAHFEGAHPAPKPAAESEAHPAG